MNYQLELQKIRLKINSEKQPIERINLLKQAIQIADQNSDIEHGYELRLDLILEEAGTAQCLESFPAFSWILDITDKNPELFDEEEGFLWEYRCMALASYRNASLTQQQIDSIFQDFRIRIERNGYSLAVYYNIKIRYYQFIGELDEVERCIKLRDRHGKDDMAFCVSCEKDAEVELELSRNNYDKAIAGIQDLISSKHKCNRAPFNTFCNAAYQLNKAEDPRASEFFEKACKELRNKEEYDSSIIEAVSLMINYNIDHNKEEAFTYFEKYNPWVLNAEDAFKYSFSKNVFRLFEGEGEKQLQLPVQHPLYNNQNQYKLKDLYQYYYQLAEQLAERFDYRSGNNYLQENLKKEQNN